MSFSKLAFRVGEARFSPFHSFQLVATNEFEHVHFAWQARCFAMVGKICKFSFLLAGARDSQFFWCVEMCFFCLLSWFMVVRIFLHWTARSFCVTSAVLCDGWKSDNFIFAGRLGRRTGFLRLLMHRKCELSSCFFVVVHVFHYFSFKIFFLFNCFNVTRIFWYLLCSLFCSLLRGVGGCGGDSNVLPMPIMLRYMYAR